MMIIAIQRLNSIFYLFIHLIQGHLSKSKTVMHQPKQTVFRQNYEQ